MRKARVDGGAVVGSGNMITAVTVEHFRGIERLEVGTLGRVNLFTGKNDCGKTALLEALWIALHVSDVAQAIFALQKLRGIHSEMDDFENSWRLVFHDGDADRGTTIVVRERDEELRLGIARDKSRPLRKGTNWALRIDLTSGAETNEYRVVDGQLEESRNGDKPGAVWISGRPGISALELRTFSALKQRQHEHEVVQVLQKIDPSIQGIEILAPSGREAALYVKLAGLASMLPFPSMGEGTQRCFEIATACVAEEASSVFLDEVENGLHHSTHEALWRWLALISAERNLQVFATTHSEECVQAAARAFTALDDDGLRVIRLDRHEHHTSAAVYDRNLVEAAERMGIEIRG